MNIFVINSLFFASSTLLIAILILLKRKDEIARRWFYFSLFVTGWAVHYSFIINNDILSATALAMARFANAWACFIPVMWLYFVCGFLEIKRRRLFWVAWPIAWLIAASAPTKSFIPGVVPLKGFIHYTTAGWVFHLHTLNFLVMVSYGFFLLIRGYQTARSEEHQKEIAALLVATAFGFAGGTSTFLPVYFRNYGIDFTLLLSLYPFLMVYAMIQHRVLDVERLAESFQREKLAAVGILSAGVNHELRNPLLVTRGNLELCLRKLGRNPNPGEEVQEFLKVRLEKSLAQVDRAVEIMQRLADFARPEAEPDRGEKVVIQEALDRVLELVNYQFRMNKITIRSEIPSGLTASFSPRQLEEVLFNLTLNACQAMPGGGELSFEARREGDEILLRIRDSGPGISPSLKGRIFEPFYSTKGEGGTGLGLYLTKQLLERRGGRITVESSPGRGTAFRLWLRVALE